MAKEGMVLGNTGTARKTGYSPSRLSLYVRCPRMFHLSRYYEPDIKNDDAMREGRLFEGYTFGHFKGGEAEETELIGRKKPATIDRIRAQAEYVAPLFQDDNGKLLGEAWVWLQHETQDYKVRGETDFLGALNWDLLPDLVLDVKAVEKLQTLLNKYKVDRYFVDLKYTASVTGVWDFKNAKEDYLQSVFYPYMYWERTGEVLPFVYLVVENTYDVPIIRLIIMEVTEDDFRYFVRPLVEQAHRDMVYPPKANKETCEGGFTYGYGRCWYMNYCEWGRRVVGGMRHFHFGDLTTDLLFKGKPEKPEEDGEEVTYHRPVWE